MNDSKRAHVATEVILGWVDAIEYFDVVETLEMHIEEQADADNLEDDAKAIYEMIREAKITIDFTGGE